MDILRLVKKAEIRISRYKRMKFRLFYVLAYTMIAICLYLGIGIIRNQIKDKTVWNGKMILEDGWNAVKGNGTSNNPYLIENATQLAWLAYTSQIETYDNTYFELKDDIKLNEYSTNEVLNGVEKYVHVNDNVVILNSDEIHEWKPIGNENYPFAGHFDGNGHTISGLYINSDENYQGLFGVCSDVSVIEDINLVGANVTSAGQYTGGIVGKSFGLINKCNVYSVYITGNGYVGGVAGMAHIIANTFSEAWIMTYGKYFEENNQIIEKCYGGIAGCCDYLINSSSYAIFENCKGIICGGLVGELTSDAYNCVSLGTPMMEINQYLTYDSDLRIGDVFGQYDGLAENEIEDKKIYFNNKNELHFQMNEEEFSLFRDKCSDLVVDYKYNDIERNYSYTGEYIIHEYSAKTEMYNSISEELSIDENASFVLNENINSMNINVDTDIYQELNAYGDGGRIMELIQWTTDNSNGTSHDDNLVPLLETTMKAKEKW